MRRPEDRQIKHAGQGYVVDIAPPPGEEFEILSSPQRASDIGVDCSVILAGRQKVSTQGRSSTSSDQALRGCRSTST